MLLEVYMIWNNDNLVPYILNKIISRVSSRSEVNCWNFWQRGDLKSSSFVSLKWRTAFSMDWENGENGGFSEDPNPKIGNTKKKQGKYDGQKVLLTLHCKSYSTLLSQEDHTPPMYIWLHSAYLLYNRHQQLVHQCKLDPCCTNLSIRKWCKHL